MKKNLNLHFFHLLFLSLFFFSSLHANTQTIDQTKQAENISASASSDASRQKENAKKYFFSIAAIFKNEEPYLKEWIEYHRLVGVEHFYLYDNSSTDNGSELLTPYIKENIVTLTPWPDGEDKGVPENKPFRWVDLTQTPAYEHALKVTAKNETTWLAMIDLDEFLLPIQSDSFCDILKKI